MQLQPKIDGGQNVDFSMYQKQLALMTQKVVKPDYPMNMLPDNNKFVPFVFTTKKKKTVY